ncbi:MAG: hypothetical protein NBV67_02850 [Tagaea sp.]|nr:hypothetical protein [Tagaea sp.]
MSYTFLSAQYANAENTAAVAITKEASAVALSAADTPEEWAALLAWGTPTAYVAQPVVRIATARQLKAALAIALPTLITESDVASPNLPASIESALAGLPTTLSDEQRIIARSTWANMTVVPEDDPMLALFRQALGKTEAELAAVFDIALAIP